MIIQNYWNSAINIVGLAIGMTASWQTAKVVFGKPARALRYE